MGVFKTTVALVALAYGILIVLCSLNIGDRMAGKECGKAATQANNGLIVMGGVMMAMSISYLACQYTYSSCGSGAQSENMNLSLFSISMILVSIVCITLASIVENNTDCIDPHVATQAIWIPGIIILFLGLILGATQINAFNKVMTSVNTFVNM